MFSPREFRMLLTDFYFISSLLSFYSNEMTPYHKWCLGRLELYRKLITNMYQNMTRKYLITEHYQICRIVLVSNLGEYLITVLEREH